MTRSKQIRLNTIQIEKQLKFLHYHLMNQKYELFTGKDLGFKRGVVEKIKFEYSALGEVFNKGLEKKKERKRTFEKIKKY